jgi:hypothetical protein
MECAGLEPGRVMSGGLGRLPSNERNIVWHHFANPTFRQIMVNWEREARSVISEFRMECGHHVEDPWFNGLITQLHKISTEFRSWWPLREVRRERELPIEFQQPDVGRLVLQPITMVFTTERRLVMRILMPMSESDTATKLHLLMTERSK